MGTVLFPAPRRETFAHRAAGAALVILLHAALILALVNALSSSRKVHSAESDEQIILLQPPKVAGPPSRKSPATLRPTRVLPAPDYGAITLPPLERKGTENALGQELFGCSLENLSALDPKDRQACADRLAINRNGAPDTRDHSGEIRLATLWARQLARKKVARLLPCFGASGQSHSGLRGLWLDVPCAIKGIGDGIDLDAQPIYRLDP